jgi:hypothetical protein
MSDETLIRIEEQLKALSERYHQDREETKSRYENERMERKEWRDAIDVKIDKIDEKIKPVVRDHEIITRGGKWIVATAASSFGLIKGWIFVKDHIK